MLSNSILNSVKKNLGLPEEMKEFDPDIIMAINSSLNILTQLGVGPDDGFQIEDSGSVWGDFIGTSKKRLNMVKTYVYAKTRLIFDPPQSSAVQECMKEVAKELEFRIQCEVDPPYETKGGDKDGDDDCS